MNWTPRLIEACRYFKAAHDSIGQKRKYTGGNYFDEHCRQVMWIVSLVTKDEDMLIAAAGHDQIEDVPATQGFTIVDIALKFGGNVAFMVRELTDVYTKENFPDMNRAMRKEYEAIRLGKISNDAKTIKLSDLISNGFSIVYHDRNFAKVYLREIETVHHHLRGGDNRLWWICWALIKMEKGYLKIINLFR